MNIFTIDERIAMGKYQGNAKSSPKGKPSPKGKSQGRGDKKQFKKKFQPKENNAKGVSLKSKKPASIKGMKALLKAKDGNEEKPEVGKKRKFDHSNGSDGKSVKKAKNYSSDNNKKSDKKDQKPTSGKHRKPYFQLVSCHSHHYSLLLMSNAVNV